MYRKLVLGWHEIMGLRNTHYIKNNYYSLHVLARLLLKQAGYDVFRETRHKLENNMATARRSTERSLQSRRIWKARSPSHSLWNLNGSTAHLQQNDRSKDEAMHSGRDCTPILENFLLPN